MGKPVTRLAQFMSEHPELTVAALMRRSGGSFSHIIDVKHGRANPTIEFASRLRAAAAEILGREVEFGDLFDVDTPPASSSRTSATK